jgi:hypothetical protein
MRAKFIRGQDTKRGLDVGKERTRKEGDLVQIDPDYYLREKKDKEKLLADGWESSEKGERAHSIIKWLHFNAPDAEFPVVIYKDWNDVHNKPIDPPWVTINVSDIVPDYLRKYSHGYDDTLNLTIKDII